MKSPVDDIRGLNADERMLAREKAKQLVAGKRPTKKNVTTVEKYPQAIVNIIRGFCITVLIAAFLISAARIGIAGYDSFIHGINIEWLGWFAGVFTILIAEFGLMACTLALSTNTSYSSRNLLWTGACICTVIALVGNVSISKLGGLEFFPHLFKYIDAVAPSFLSLIMAYILKQQFLDSVEAEHKAQTEYEREEALWEETRQKAEIQPTWNQNYALALKEKIEQVNRRLKLGQQALPQLTYEDWLFLINREAKADVQFSTAIGDITDTPRLAASTEQNVRPATPNPEYYESMQQGKTYQEADYSNREYIEDEGYQIGYTEINDKGKRVVVCNLCSFTGEGYSEPSSAHKALHSHWRLKHKNRTSDLKDYQQ